MAPTSTNASRPWWGAEAGAVVADLESDAVAGLTPAEAGRRLDVYGPNELDEEPSRRRVLMFGAQFANTMIVVLLVAAAVTLVIGDTKDAIVITAIVTLNAIIGFVQEYRAEQAMAALRTMAAPNARVVRGGTESTIPAAGLVSGDLIVLEAGDIVPADARLIESPNLRVNEAALTGESVPVDKASTAIDDDAGELVGDRVNMVFKGTSVVAGRATAVIVATGMRTALGGIAGLLKAHKAPSTPLQKRLAVLGRRLAAAAVVVCIIVFTVGVLRGEDVELMFLTAVSLAVAAIPEALPAVVTIALALGAQRMAEQGALSRKLPAVETLGSVTVICSDKTGTLTQGRMLAERVWTFDGEIKVTGDGYSPDGELISADGAVSIEGSSLTARLILAGAMCNDAVLIAPDSPDGAWSVAGDPTEGALLSLAAKAGIDRDGLREAYERIEEIPFDADRKRMSTVHRTPGDRGMLLASKGAIEPILESCTFYADQSGDVALTHNALSAIAGQVTAYTTAGYRVLAIAGRTIDDNRLADYDRIETDLVLYGLIAMADPARPESADAVEACKLAGIIPVMITGDHPATGEAIANRLGILGDREVLTGGRLAAEHAEGLARHVDRVGVYARTSPDQKLDIVRAWQERGDIVAMTGDGVNDAPALRRADIGVAMGLAGTEVAKEAADMVLTDDNFATIVFAVGEGRRIYDNIRRFVRYTLTSNSAEIWVMLLGPFVGLPLPLLPVQILWINLVTDGLPGLALAIEPAERDVMKRPPRPPDESVFARGLWQHVAIVGLLMGLIPLGLGLWANASGRPWQTMVFTSLALLQLGFALAVRSEIDSLRSLGLGSNRPLLLAVAGTLLLQLVVVFWPPAQDLLNAEALSLFELGIVLVASTGVLWAVELEKLVRRRRQARREVPSTQSSSTGQ